LKNLGWTRDQNPQRIGFSKDKRDSTKNRGGRKVSETYDFGWEERPPNFRNAKGVNRAGVQKSYRRGQIRSRSKKKKPSDFEIVIIWQGLTCGFTYEEDVRSWEERKLKEKKSFHGQGRPGANAKRDRGDLNIPATEKIVRWVEWGVLGARTKKSHPGFRRPGDSGSRRGVNVMSKQPS